MTENTAENVRLTVHAWGFFKDDRPRTPSGIAVSAETPHDAFARIRANITHHGGLNTNTRVTRTLDGWFLGAEWETPQREDGSANRMWHVVTQESESWPMPGLSESGTPTTQAATS